MCILYIYREYLLCLQSNANGRFLEKSTNSVEQQLRFSHFQGSLKVFKSFKVLKLFKYLKVFQNLRSK